MKNPRWLAVFMDEHGQIGAAMLTGSAVGDLPFGVNPSALNIEGADGGVALIEMPTDAEFRPMIVDCDRDDEVALQFIDLGSAE